MRKRQKLQRNVEILQTEFPLMFSEVKSLSSGIPFLIFYSELWRFRWNCSTCCRDCLLILRNFVMELSFVHRNAAGVIMCESYFDPANIEHATITQEGEHNSGTRFYIIAPTTQWRYWNLNSQTLTFPQYLLTYISCGVCFPRITPSRSILPRNRQLSKEWFRFSWVLPLWFFHQQTQLTIVVSDL